MEKIKVAVSIMVVLVLVLGCAPKELPEPKTVQAPDPLEWLPAYFKPPTRAARYEFTSSETVWNGYFIKELATGQSWMAVPSETVDGAYVMTHMGSKYTYVVAPSIDTPGRFVAIRQGTGEPATLETPLHVPTPQSWRPKSVPPGFVLKDSGSGKVIAVPGAELKKKDPELRETVPERVVVVDPPRPVKQYTGKDIRAAHKAAEQRPRKNEEAIFEFVYKEGQIYRVSGAPFHITTLFLEPGEKIQGTPFVGDPENWLAEGAVIVGGGKEEPQPVIVLSPKFPDEGKHTNMTVVTDRRVYMLKLIANHTTYLTAVKWTYPERYRQKVLAQLELDRQAAEQKKVEEQSAIDVDNIFTGYTIMPKKRSDIPLWMPITVFDDGRKTWIEFSETMEHREAPALFLKSGKKDQIVNYYVVPGPQGRVRYVVHRVFEEAELRLITDKKRVVYISRDIPLSR